MGEIRTVLWLEDTATYDLQEMAAVVRMDGRFDLVIADNVSDAAAYVRRREFDVVIVDVRVPPGIDEEWERVFRDHDSNRLAAKLGCYFLAWLLGDSNASGMGLRPAWATPTRIGVMTVEPYSELPESLTSRGITYRQKRANTPEDALVDLVEAVLKRVEGKKD
jgi:hypothetical protein